MTGNLNGAFMVNALQCNGFCKGPLCEEVPDGFALGTALSQAWLSKEVLCFRMNRELGRKEKKKGLGSLSRNSY